MLLTPSAVSAAIGEDFVGFLDGIFLKKSNRVAILIYEYAGKLAREAREN